MPSENKITTMKRNNAIIDPLLAYYFGRVQDAIKAIASQPPYSIGEQDLEPFIRQFMLSGRADKIGIRAIVDQCFAQDIEYAACAQEILDRYYKKFHNNIMAGKGIVSEKTTYKTYEQFVNENTTNADGLYGFNILLDLLGNLSIKFINTNNKNYLNTGTFNLFFYTTAIQAHLEVLDELNSKKSLTTTANTAKSMPTISGLSFFFGVKDYACTYGFYDTSQNKITVTGNFKIDAGLIRKVAKLESANSLGRILSTINLNTLTLLGKVKQDFKEYLIESKPMQIISDKILVKCFTTSDFKNPATTYSDYHAHFSNWLFKHRWNQKVTHAVELDGDSVKFYIYAK